MEESDVDRMPIGWRNCKIGDVTLIVSKIDQSKDPNRRISYIDISSIDNALNRIREAKTFNLREAPSRARQLIYCGDVLFSTVRPYLRNIALVPKEYDGEIASTGFSVLRPAVGIVPKFLFYKCTSREFVNALSGEQYGVSYPAVKDEQVKAQALRLPPTNEQVRIVEKLEELFSELDKGIESLKTAREQLKVYRQAVLKHAFEGKLTADWRAANPDKLETAEELLVRINAECEVRHQQRIKEWKAAVKAWEYAGKGEKMPAKPRAYGGNIELLTADCANLPMGWYWFPVSDILLESPSNGRSVKDRSDGFPVLRLTAVRDGKIDLRERKNGDWNRDGALQFLVHEDDFLISRGNGSKRLVGRGGVVPANPDEVAYPDTMIRLRIDQQLVLPDVFCRIWNSRIIRDQIESVAHTTAGIYKINQGHIGKFIIPVMSLAEQEELISRLDEILSKVDALEADIEISLRNTDVLRQSILKKAFSGQLVPQDPHDEPASVLLERIHAERDSQKTSRRARKVRAPA
jgi:type I restriction enzyme S subunit